MDKKYRIRQSSGRITGPFLKGQIHDLLNSNQIQDQDECQEFPGGDWKRLSFYKTVWQQEIIEEVKPTPLPIIENNDEPEHKNETVTVNADGETIREFRFSSKNRKEDIDYAELERKYQQKKGSDLTRTDRYSGSDSDKTRVVNPQVNIEGNKTIIIKSDVPLAPDLLAIQKSEEKEKNKIENIDQESSINSKLVVSPNESTTVIRLDEIVGTAHQEADAAEEEINQQIERDLRKEQLKDKIKKPIAELKETAKKGMKPAVAIAFLAIIWFVLFDEEEQKKIDPRYVIISFPAMEKVENVTLSKEAYEQGLQIYQKGTYEDRIIAANFFKQSLSHKFEENPAFGNLILTYSELLPNTKDVMISANELYKMTQIAKTKIFTDINVALGTALLYEQVGKKEAAGKLMEEFIRVSKKTTPKFYAKYLDLLIKNRSLENAKKVLDKISTIRPRTEEIYLALAAFNELDEKGEEARALIEEAVKAYPRSVRLLLARAEYLQRDGDMMNLEKVLITIKSLYAENSPVYYAKYLEYSGVLLASRKKINEAAALFKLALKITENSELRAKLASLDMGGGKNAENLIKESKVIQLIKESEKAQNEQRWDIAFRYAIEASDLAPENIAAQMTLASLQIKRGYLQAALNGLNELQKKFPTNTDISFKIVEALIYAKKFKEAQKQIGLIAQTDVKNSSRYSSLMALYYRKSGNFILAVKWFQEAINRNPLNDHDYYLLAQTFLEYRRYKESKSMIARAMALDPANVDYMVLYAKILYELDSVETAVGYLREVLRESPDNPKIMSDIAIYYHKSGQIKFFEMYRDLVMRGSSKNEDFYRFLLSLSMLEEKQEDYERYAKELISISPGDLETRMELGVHYFKNKKNVEAKSAFEELREMLPSYPKTNYYLASIYLNENMLEKALVYADKEIEENPELEHGYQIKGRVLMVMKKHAEAIRLFEKALSLNVSSVDSLIALADTRFGQNNLEQARELYLRALKHDPVNAHIHKQLGHIYKGMGQSALAIESYKVYLDIKPDAADRQQIEAIMNSLR